jgi:hypothetical protein
MRRQKEAMLRRLVRENSPTVVLASIVVVIQETAEDIARDLLRDPAFRSHLRAEVRLATHFMVRDLRAGLLTPRQGPRASDAEV